MQPKALEKLNLTRSLTNLTPIPSFSMPTFEESGAQAKKSKVTNQIVNTKQTFFSREKGTATTEDGRSSSLCSWKPSQMPPAKKFAKDISTFDMKAPLLKLPAPRCSDLINVGDHSDATGQSSTASTSNLLLAQAPSSSETDVTYAQADVTMRVCRMACLFCLLKFGSDATLYVSLALHL